MKYDESSGMWVCGDPLPPVTSSDNGKVLAVKDGAWAADSNLFLVTVTNFASDKSRSEILDAIAKGRSVVLIKGTSYYFPSGQDNSYVYFISEAKIANDRYLNVIAVNESKVASVDKIHITVVLPTRKVIRCAFY